MPNYITIPLTSEPGIQRDGTPYNSKSYISGQWCRFYMGLPRKIGGYKVIDQGNGTIIRSMFNVPKQNSVDTYLGRADSLKYIHFDFNGVGLAEVDRTPENYFVTVGGFGPYYDPNNQWTFDLFTNKVNPEDSIIVAQVAPNSSDVSNTTEGPVYHGDTIGPSQNAPLVQALHDDGSAVLASGGIVYASPIMIAYGNNGIIKWSEEGDITSWPLLNNQAIANTKIIRMIRTRGSAAPQLLAWTLNSLLSVSYITSGSNVAFSAVTVEENITVLAPNAIVGYDQQFFWPGIDQFYFFNGIVQKLDNSMSTDYFFDNVNLSQRSKIWGMAVPRFKEWWLFYPEGNSTECNRVLIYNLDIRKWYDSSISRAAGVSAGIFPLPMMSDNEALRVITRSGHIDVYPLWMHEYGYDKVIDEENIQSIPSSFETRIITLFEGSPQNNRLLRSRRIENDFRQAGNMTVTVNNRMFPSDTLANGRLTQSGPYTFNVNTQKIDDINSQGRFVSFLFESNELGGSYQMGKVLLDYDVGDVKPS